MFVSYYMITFVSFHTVNTNEYNLHLCFDEPNLDWGGWFGPKYQKCKSYFFYQRMSYKKSHSIE